MADAGATVADVDLALFSNTTQALMEGQHTIAGQVALRVDGVYAGLPIINVENACASGSTAVYQAVGHAARGNVGGRARGRRREDA